MIKELRAQRARLVTEARGHIEKPNATVEDQVAFDAAMAEVDRLQVRIDGLVRVDALDKELATAAVTSASEKQNRPVSVDEAVTAVAREKRVLRAMLRGNTGGLTDDERTHYANGMAAVQNAASTGTSTAGGYTIAPEFMRELLIAMKAQGGMRALAREIQTDSGVNLPWPTMDDRSNVATIISENAAVGSDTDLVFGSNTLTGYTYKSGVLLLSLQILQDSAFDFDTLVRDAISGRFVRGQNAHFTTGTGTGQPQGVLTAAPIGVTGATGSTLTCTLDNVLDLIHSVDPVYRQGARFMCHDQTLQMLRKLKDTNGRYLWQPYDNGAVAGPPGDTIWGYPLTINQDTPVMAANAISLAFGNFQNYIIRDILGMQMMVLRERYADYLQVGYIAFCRTDGRLVTAAAPIKTFKNSAT